MFGASYLTWNFFLFFTLKCLYSLDSSSLINVRAACRHLANHRRVPLLTFLPWHKLSDNLVKSLIFYYTFITRCLRNSVIWVRGEIILKGAEQNGWGPRCQAWQSKKELNEIRRHIKCFCHWWIPFPWQLQQDGIYFIWGVMVLVVRGVCVQMGSSSYGCQQIQAKSTAYSKSFCFFF